MVDRLEAGMRNLERLMNKKPGFQMSLVRGAGAGGGFTGGAAFFLGAESRPGAEWVMDRTGFYRLLLSVDHVITGEGRLDSQSISGKTVGTVSGACICENKPFSVICGQNSLEPYHLNQIGASRVISLSEYSGGVTSALKEPVRWLREAASLLVSGLD